MSNEELIKVLTEDIQSHRDYIQRLYRSAFAVGAVLISFGIGFGYWFLGKQIDTKVLDYRIVESLKERTEEASSVIIENSKEEAQKQVSKYISEEIGNKVEKIVQPQIEQLSKQSLPEIFKKSALPVGAVIPFNRATGCPSGWEEYKLAYGRVIRGIDQTGSIDPDGIRKTGSLQDDSLQEHTHSYGRMTFPENDQGQPNKSEDNDGRILTYQTSGVHGARVNGNETRMKNVALLYCEKK